jgi:hypothetical protein
MAQKEIAHIAEALQTVRDAGYEVFYNPDEGEFSEHILSQEEIAEETKKVTEELKKETYIPSREALSRSGYTDMFEYLQEILEGATSIACCKFLCAVEADGHCSHGNQSVELSLGMI